MTAGSCLVCVESVMCMLAHVWHYGVSFDAVIWMPDQVRHDIFVPA